MTLGRSVLTLFALLRYFENIHDQLLAACIWKMVGAIEYQEEPRIPCLPWVSLDTVKHPDPLGINCCIYIFYPCSEGSTGGDCGSYSTISTA